MKLRYISFITINTIALPLFGQTKKVAESGMMEWALNNIVLLMGLATFLAGLWAIAKLSLGLIELQKLRMLREMGIEPDDTPSGPSRLEKLYTWFLGLKPIEQEEDIALGHSFDGIRELDNSLPPWWIYMFYASILAAGVYMYVYHWSGSGWSSIKEYEIAMKIADEQKMAYLDKMANAINENNVTLLEDEESLEIGKAIFINKCASCHGQLGEGLVGPNFADQYWIHGGDITDLFRVIKYGVKEKGMISWKSQLRPSSMQKVASYILTLEGTDPPNQKDAEGALYDRAKENKASEEPLSSQ